MPMAMVSTGIAVPCMPIAWPAMMLVACPVCDALAIARTGQNCAPVKNSVATTRMTVMPIPTTAHQKRLLIGVAPGRKLVAPVEVMAVWKSPPSRWVTRKKRGRAMITETARPR